MGGHAVCLRGAPLTPLDEPLCWFPVWAAADQTQERGPRVLCVRPRRAGTCQQTLSYLFGSERVSAAHL